MSYTATGLEAIDKTLHKTNEWLRDIEGELGWEDRHFAFQALRAVLHILRDRLQVQEAADLASQLPLLIRGLFFENWKPAAPLRDKQTEEFLERILAYFPKDESLDTERVARAVFRVMRKHISEGEIGDVLATLPPALRQLWN